MCGRYSITKPVEAVQRHFQVLDRPNLPPRYNVAPTQDCPVVRLDGDGQLRLALLRWGLVPSWADDPAIASRLINARSESAAEKPAFRAAFRRRRCLVAADGFYEWKKAGEGKGARKQPDRITLADGGLFAFAGLWEQWRPDAAASPLETFTILTTEASTRLAGIHPRMPVILPPDAYGAWLDPAAEVEALKALLRPCPDEAVTAVPVSTRVNAVANDDPDVIAPLDASGTGDDGAGQQRLL